MCPRNMKMFKYASSYAFVKKFSRCDSISTTRRASLNGPMLQEDSLKPCVTVICVHPNPVVGFGNL